MTKFCSPTILVVVLLAAVFFAPTARADCPGYVTPEFRTDLNFTNSSLTNNTLHLPGGQLRYINLGEVNNTAVDLRVTVAASSHYQGYILDRWNARSKPIPNHWNTGQFGRINLQSNGTISSGLGIFDFCIVEAGTETEIAPAQFHFTVYDEDQRFTNWDANTVGAHERMFFDTAQAHSYQLWPNISHSEVELKCLDGTDASNTSCPAGEATIFHSSTHGTGPDNPSDPNALTNEQKRRSVAFTFQNRACFQMSYELYCPALVLPEHYDGMVCKNNGVAGGNFLYSGASPELITGGECITPPPTTMPSDAPSDQPSQTPTDTHAPSDQPSLTPTDTQQPSAEPTEPPNNTWGGNCTVPGTAHDNYGTLNLCLRTSLGYTYDNGVDPVTFQEVNFIETLIRIEYDMSVGFCVDAFSVGPKERELTTITEDYSDGLLAYLCIASQHPEYVPAEHLETVLLSDGTTSDTRPKPLTDYNAIGGTKKFNQGALINVCVRVKDEYILEGLELDGLESFSWTRTGGTTYDQDVGGGGDADATIEQPAINSFGPASNFLTSYVNSNCVGTTNCDFASILFAQFYNTDGEVTGEGTGNLRFARRRRLGDETIMGGRRLQDQDDPGQTGVDITINVLKPADGPGALRTAGGYSPNIAFGVLATIAIAIFGTAFLA